VAHIADRENAGNVGFEQKWVAIELPSLRTLSIANKIWARKQETALIPLDDIR
jgi:hypothetical protein